MDIPGRAQRQGVSSNKKKGWLPSPFVCEFELNYFRCLPIRPAISNMET